MVIGPVQDWQFSDFPEDNDGSKWKVQLVQQATNTAIFLPYVKYDDIVTTNYSIFYSIWDLVVIIPGDNPLSVPAESLPKLCALAENSAAFVTAHQN